MRLVLQFITADLYEGITYTLQFDISQLRLYFVCLCCACVCVDRARSSQYDCVFLSQLPGNKYTDRFLHGHGVCVRRRAV